VLHASTPGLWGHPHDVRIERPERDFLPLSIRRVHPRGPDRTEDPAMTPSTRRSFLTASALGVTAVALPTAGAHASPGPLGPDGGSSVALASYVFGGSGHLAVDSSSDPGSGLNIGQQDLTLECWFRLAPRDRDAIDEEFLVFVDYPEATFGFGGYSLSIHLDYSQGIEQDPDDESLAMARLELQIGNEAITSSVGFDEAWHHIALMRANDPISNATELTVLVDGQVRFNLERAQVPFSLGPPLTPFVVGARLDEFRMSPDDDGQFDPDYEAYSEPSGRLIGSVSNVRLVVGRAIYPVVVDEFDEFAPYTPDPLPLGRVVGTGVSTPLLLRAEDSLNDAGDTARAITVVGTGVSLSTDDVPST